MPFRARLLNRSGSMDSFPAMRACATVSRAQSVQIRPSSRVREHHMNAGPSTLLLGSGAKAQAERQTNLYAPATYAVAVLGAAATALSASINPVIGLFVAALVCGWAEIDGLCGSSHVGALTPLRALDKTYRLWLHATSAYTLGGVVTASVIGLTLGLVGTAARNTDFAPQFGFALLAVSALILAVRELGLLSFALPQFHRQTDKMWALRFGYVTGAAMWGSHIGLGFATVIRHGGLFVIAGSALLLEPLQGALLLASFWIGRTLPIWATPLLTRDERDGGVVTDLLLARPDSYRICAFAGLAGLGLIGAVLAMGPF